MKNISLNVRFEVVDHAIVHLDPDLLDAAADLIERRKHDRKLSMERKQRRIQRNREYSADLQLAGLI